MAFRHLRSLAAPSLADLRLPGLVMAGFGVLALVGPGCGGSVFTSSDADSDAGDGDGDDSGDGDGDGSWSPSGGSTGDGDSPGSGGAEGAGGSPGSGGNLNGNNFCSQTGQCALTSATCCGTCGEPTVADMVGVPKDELEGYRNLVCGENPPPCPACAALPSPNLFAECVQGECVAVDLTRHADAGCTTSDECILMPAACCECGAGTSEWEIVAINKDRTESFREFHCGAEPVGCPECEWTPPDQFTAICDDNRCTVVPAVSAN